jgi:hypothetical protein
VGDFRLREHFLNVEFRIGVSEELELCLVYRVLKGCVPVDSDCKVLNGAIEALVPKLEDSNCHNPVLDILYSSKDLTELLDSEIDGCFEQYLPRGASDE